MSCVDLLSTIEKTFGLRCLHNEVKIIDLLGRADEMPSLEIFKLTGRSISGHNSDLKRLSLLGLVEWENGNEDRRKRLYKLTDSGVNIYHLLSKTGQI